MPDRSIAPFQGFGLGLRPPHYQDFLTRDVPVDFVEIISENFMVEGGRPLTVIDAVRERHPVAMHGVSMSIGSADGLSSDYLRRLKKLADRVRPLWVSDHLCWTGVEGFNSHDLLPLPYGEEAMELVCANIHHAQDVLERPILMENPSSYVAFAGDEMTEWDFLAEMCRRTGCFMLLDVNNIYVSGINHGFDPFTYLSGIPMDRVRQIHLAGHSVGRDRLIDTHDRAVCDPVWTLYQAACRRLGSVATMIERDDDIPPLGDLLTELDIARTHAAAQQADHQPSSRARVSLLEVQRQFRDYLLDAPSDIAERAGKDADKGLPVYHNAYRAQLVACLRDTFGTVWAWLGDEAFETAARRHIEVHPPHSWTLGNYGVEFPETLHALYSDDAEVTDLAHLDWALRRAFDGVDADSLTLADLGAIDWDTAVLHFAPTLRLFPISTNCGAIWNAVARGDTPPGAEALPSPAAVRVWRAGLSPRFCSIETIEALTLERAMGGATFGALCAYLETETDAAQAAGLAGQMLTSWLNDGVIVTID